MPPNKKKQGIANLARMMKTLDREVSRCSKCGMCQAVCPVYSLTGHEMDTARGKLALLDGLSQEMFTDADGTAARLNHCLLCGACGGGCPMNIDTTALFLNARAIIEGFRGLPWWKRFLFRWVMARPGRFDRLLAWAARFQSLVLKQKPTPLDGSCSRVASPRLSGRHVIPLAPVSFHVMKKQKSEPVKSTAKSVPASASVIAVGRRGIRVAFFVGCLLDKVFPETAKNIVGVLEQSGVEVIAPDDQGCCGMPVLAGGDREAFLRLMADHLVRFDPDQFDYLVTGCATCTAAIKKLWPEMTNGLSDPLRSAVNQIADKTHDISEFLVNILGVAEGMVSDGYTTPPVPPDAAATSVPMHSAHSDAGKASPVHGARAASGCPAAARVVATWHDPCHLAKTLGIRQEPRLLIKANPAYAFREMADPDLCCGMGGSFNLQYYDDSTAIGMKKIDAIRASGASVVATGCPACMIQLSDMLARADVPVAVRHVIDIFANRD
jgi:glycolate oxidase iron-sulfur subunit